MFREKTYQHALIQPEKENAIKPVYFSFYRNTWMLVLQQTHNILSNSSTELLLLPLGAIRWNKGNPEGDVYKLLRLKFFLETLT